MPSWVSIVCPACGSTVKVPANRAILACGHCGTELVIQKSGDIISLASMAEALRAVEDAPAADSSSSPITNAWSQSHTRIVILDLLSEIDQLWIERSREFSTSIRLLAIAVAGLLIALSVDVAWLRCLAVLVGLIGLPGLYGLYDHFVGKSKEARRQRLEQAVIAIWPMLDSSNSDTTSASSMTQSSTSPAPD